MNQLKSYNLLPAANAVSSTFSNWSSEVSLSKTLTAFGVFDTRVWQHKFRHTFARSIDLDNMSNIVWNPD